MTRPTTWSHHDQHHADNSNGGTRSTESGQLVNPANLLLLPSAWLRPVVTVDLMSLVGRPS